MAGHVEEFNQMFGFRSESCHGNLDILADAWRAAKHALDSQTGMTEDSWNGTW